MLAKQDCSKFRSDDEPKRQHDAQRRDRGKPPDQRIVGWRPRPPPRKNSMQSEAGFARTTRRAVVRCCDWQCFKEANRDMRARPYQDPACPGRSRSARRAFPVVWEARTRRRRFCCNAGESAGEDRVARDELIRSINSRRLAMQHAIDGLCPYTDEANAPSANSSNCRWTDRSMGKQTGLRINESLVSVGGPPAVRARDDLCMALLVTRAATTRPRRMSRRSWDGSAAFREILTGRLNKHSV